MTEEDEIFNNILRHIQNIDPDIMRSKHPSIEFSRYWSVNRTNFQLIGLKAYFKIHKITPILLLMEECMSIDMAKNLKTRLSILGLKHFRKYSNFGNSVEEEEDQEIEKDHYGYVYVYRTEENLDNTRFQNEIKAYEMGLYSVTNPITLENDIMNKTEFELTYYKN